MKYLRKYKYLITIIIVILILIGLIIIKINLKTNNAKVISSKNFELKNTNTKLVEENKKTIAQYVDIKGAIVNPGVYEITKNMRVKDVINVAGGLIENSNTSLINLSKLVTDQMVIIIYTNEEIKNNNEDSAIKIIENECICPNIKNDGCINVTKEKKTSEEKEEVVNYPININTASLEELQKITGIGETKAIAIIEYRESNGNFNTIEDILNVSGIGQSTYEKIKNQITV